MNLRSENFKFFSPQFQRKSNNIGASSRTSRNNNDDIVGKFSQLKIDFIKKFKLNFPNISRIHVERVTTLRQRNKVL